jgi:cytidyltransferase-like protein
VIVTTEELAGLKGRVAMVDGGFDPIHPGHIAYIAGAAELGAPVLCNVSGDHWVARKHPPLLAEDERIKVIDALRDVTYTHLSRSSTAEVLQALEPRYYVKGADWRDRLPEEELAVCASRGIEVIYLDTVLDSSTRLLERYRRAAESETS